MNVILIVEDDFPNYLLIKNHLENTKAITILAKNGIEAVDYIRSNNDISLVLMDLRMPAMDGFYATKIIKSLRPDLPVIAQTAYFASDNKNLVEEAGFDEYIRRPYTEEELLEKIRPFLK
ncbi:MAG: response regulator [Breznakibacter sp.]|nr:response regulator [Breznakibacter sp.]